MGLRGSLELAALPPRGDCAMRVRFWGENTRGLEKWVKLSLGHFFVKFDRPLTRAFHPKARSHDPITALS